MARLLRNGTGLAYEQVGQGQPPLVLIHGAFADHSVYDAQVAYFSPNHRIVAVDLRGHGDSDKPEEAYTIPGFADDVAWMCRELGLNQPVLIGHSLGGLVAVQVAATNPERVAAVVALDSPSLIPGWNERFVVPVDREMSRANFRESLESFLASAHHPVDDLERRRRVLDGISQLPEHSVIATWRALLAWDPTPAIDACRVPFLYVDHGQPGCHLDLLLGHVPQMVTGQTVGTGHLALMEVPDQVNAMLERFITHAPALAEHARASADAG